MIRQPRSRIALIAVLACFGLRAQAGVLLQGFYWDVPSPAAGNSSAQWWWDHLAAQAKSLRSHGFTAVWIPPVCKGASGGYSVGYDPFDDYDLGSKSEKGTTPTRYGTREQLERCCAIFRANNLDIYADLVYNHRDGDSGNWQFNYADAYGVTPGGRFGKSTNDFHPNVPQDPNVPAGSGENFNAFGRDLAHINGAAHYIYHNLMYAGNWLTQALDLQGYRLDDVPGISTDWLNPFLTQGPVSGKFAVGEFFSYTLSDLQGWISQMQGHSTAFDFPYRGLLKQMCNSPSSFDMSTLDHAGLEGVDPYHAVTFVENHDTDRSDPVVQNKALAYACILTSEGYPSVFYRDYSKDPGCYGMEDVIDNLIWIHENLASGTTQQRFKNKLVFMYERMGGHHLLVGLNNNVGYNYIVYNVQAGFGPNVTLHDYTGHAADVTTDANGQVTLTLPPAINGLGYSCYSVTGLGGLFANVPKSTTQVYAGAQDLDIKPADNSGLIQICRIQCAPSSHVNGTLYFSKTGWLSSTSLYLELDSPTGSKVAGLTATYQTASGAVLSATASAGGLYTFKIRAYGASSSNPRLPYFLGANYVAPQAFSP